VKIVITMVYMLWDVAETSARPTQGCVPASPRIQHAHNHGLPRAGAEATTMRNAGVVGVLYT